MHRYERFFGTGVSLARAFLRHGRFLGTGVSSARAFLRHERFFGRSVSSAGAFLQQEHFFGTNVSSAPAREKVRSLEQCESARDVRGVQYPLFIPYPRKVPAGYMRSYGA